MKKILLITSSRIGDAILSTTILNHFTTQFPQAKVTVACGHVPASLFEDLPNLEKLIPLPSKKYGQHWLKIYRNTVGTKWDVIVDLRGSVIAYLLRGSQKYIWRSKDDSTTRHQQLCDLVGAPHTTTPKLWVSNQRIHEISPALPDKMIGLGPAANWIGKQWPLENFKAFADYLLHDCAMTKSHKLALFAAPNEWESLQPLIQAIPQDRLFLVNHSTHLLDVAAVLQNCEAYVGNDSGLMHMAAALGVPTLGLFGPSKDQLYRPTGAAVSFIRTPESYETLWQRVKNGQEDGLMDSLTVPAVIQSFETLMKPLQTHSVTG